MPERRDPRQLVARSIALLGLGMCCAYMLLWLVTPWPEARLQLRPMLLLIAILLLFWPVEDA